YSVFGYLNDDSLLRDGGVLRARQKFVGQNKLDPATHQLIANANREWDPGTGVLVRNPDPSDAATTAANVGQAVSASGVINYLNKFGQMTTQNHQSYDPVSELYYAAIRYLKRQGNVAEYSNLNGTSSQRYDNVDGFPVITSWDDPMQYRCQNNALLGIGGVNTHRDKNLPGNGVTTDEPTRPATVTSDSTVNVVTATRKVADLEGISIPTPFTGRENSAYIAGLAYDSHTKDLRMDLEGMQTASTYWVDVRENQVLEPRSRNQYWLAAKYGGFTVPENYHPYTQTAALDAALWSSGETLSTGDLRPENFYVASEADKMVESLTRAFAKIAAETAGSGSALAASSTGVDTDARTFQAQFFSGTWRGDLRAFAVQSNGTLSASPLWRAGALLQSADWSTRPIYVHNPQGGNAAARYRLFAWANLGSNQASALGSQDVVDYLRGNRTKEESQANGTLRMRTGVLGDIVNSTPTFVGAPNAGLYLQASFDGAAAYRAFVRNQSSRTGVVYVGANDGMLHGFNAATGVETYAFVPAAAIANGLRTYTDPTYEHRYFVDGELAVTDIYDTTANAWKSVLVGTLGRGGPGIFALDVTNPADVKFLWEKNGTDIPALGKNIGRPIIAQVADGDWRVLVGNGHGTAAGLAQLVMIDVRSGSSTVVSTGVAGDNALTAVLARDADGNGFAETAYAGDLRGNMWKFTGLGAATSVQKIFEARDPSGTVQPITAAPLVGKDPSTNLTWVFFGTGRYLSTADPADRQVQTWYGVKDTGVGIGTRSNLVRRSIIAETRVGTLDVRAVQDGAVGELVGQRGWYMDLVSPVTGPRGERMVVPNRFQGTALIGITRVPDASDVCRPTGTGFVMTLNPFTGARLPDSFFDVNRDGRFTDADEVNVNNQPAAASGIGFGDGLNASIIGNRLHANLDSSEFDGLDIRPPATDAGRMSWREIVN
ncbi:MAG: PilC/PilY family type IV pilus protein, partial [Pseudomonadota bacterium]|nr:PilC/PilY family type IV pilus protein [Pseudomonadota bacterium]